MLKYCTFCREYHKNPNIRAMRKNLDGDGDGDENHLDEEEVHVDGDDEGDEE